MEVKRKILGKILSAFWGILRFAPPCYDDKMRLYLLFSIAALTCAASTVTFQPQPGTGPAVPVNVTISDTATGVSIQTAISGPVVGDLRGLFFDLSGSLPACADISGWSDCQVAEGAVVDLGGGVNMHGVGMFDVGLEIGTPGIGADDIQGAIVTIINGNICASNFQGIGVRLTSVGTAGGLREDSSKLIDRTPDGGTTGTPELS